MSTPVQTGGVVTLDPTGAGTVTLGPIRSGERWTVTRYTTAGSSAAEPALEVHRGSAGLVDTTPHGNSDVSEVTADLSLWAGESLAFKYTGGTPGATMTVYLEGTADRGPGT